jgi:hypothetical protein
MVEVTRRCEQGEKMKPAEYTIKGQNKDDEAAEVMKK